MDRAFSGLRSALGLLLLLAAFACFATSPRPGSAHNPTLRSPRAGVPTLTSWNGLEVVLAAKLPMRSRGHPVLTAAEPVPVSASLTWGPADTLRIDASRAGSHSGSRPALPR